MCERTHRVHKLTVCCALDQISTGTRLEDLHEVGIFSVHGQDENLRANIFRDHFLRCGNSVHLSHREVHHDNVRIHALGERNSLAAVRRLADYLNVLCGAENCLHSRPNHRVVVGENHLDDICCHGWSCVVISATTRVPPLGILSIFMLPPARLMRSFTVLSPVFCVPVLTCDVSKPQPSSATSILIKPAFATTSTVAYFALECISMFRRASCATRNSVAETFFGTDGPSMVNLKYT